MSVTGFIESRSGPFIYKDPDARRTYGVAWEIPEGDTIDSAVWTVGTGLSHELPAIEGNVTEIVLYGGTAGVDYKVKCKMATFSGEADARSFTVKVKNR
jgi:hypothetical protein